MAEWSLDYQSAVQIYNRWHAKFYRSHPAWFQVKLLIVALCTLRLTVLPLQEECVMKILRCMGNEVVIGNNDLKFSHETGVELATSDATPEGYFTIPVSDRQQLQEVSRLPMSCQSVVATDRLLDYSSEVWVSHATDFP
jgi:hypothetical protein